MTTESELMAQLRGICSKADRARREAQTEAHRRGWASIGQEDIVTREQAREVFRELRKSSTVDGVRQRDFLNELNRLAAQGSLN